MLLPKQESAAGLKPEGEEDITIRRFTARRRILAAAKQRFARQGYEHVSLQEVAAAAGLPLRDLSKHYEDKARLLSAVLDDAWKDLLPRVNDVAASATTAPSALVSVFAYITSYLHKDEDLARLLLWEGRRPDPETGEIRSSGGYCRFLQTCGNLVARGQRDGSFRADLHPQVAGSMLVGALEGMLRDRLLAEQDQSITGYTSSYLLSTYDALVSSLKV